MHKIATFAAAGAVAAVALTTAGAASAQQAILSAPDQIAACLCLGQTVTRESSELTQRRDAWQEKQRAVNALDAQVTTERPRVNVEDPSAIAAFKTLLARRDAAAQSFAAEDTPKYQSFVEKYNARVAEFNRSCAGKVYDAVAEAQVRRTLSCPKE